MAKRLFLLDGMALAFRAYFAFIKRPIVNSKGFNTSAIFGYTNTLLDVLSNQNPTHVAVALDTAEPTHRHREFPEYKAQREEMPEALAANLPYIRQVTEAFNIPLLVSPGFEADDIIGTLAKKAESESYETYMVTPDKDFGQLVSEKTFLYKPAHLGNAVEIWGPPEVLDKWQIARLDQVVDILGLAGDPSDNIPGVPGIGQKTASKLIAEYGSIENLLDHIDDLKGKQKERLETHREQALLSKRLAKILCDVPLKVSPKELAVQERNHEALKKLFVELEFNSIGRRLFGEDFKAGRGYSPEAQPGLFDSAPASEKEPENQAIASGLKTIADVKHDYQLITREVEMKKLAKTLAKEKSICFDAETTSLDASIAEIVGLAISFKKHTGYYVAFPEDREKTRALLDIFKPVLGNEGIEKVGHNLKYDLSVLKWHGVDARGTLFDTMLAHSLIDPDSRHGMDFLSERFLGYTPVTITSLIGDKKGEQISMREVPLETVAEYAAEDADVTWQLKTALEPLLKEKGQERVFYEIEAPLTPALAAMECAGVRLDASALAEFSAKLARVIEQLRNRIYELAGVEFNLNSPKQLGEVLFEKLRLVDKPKKTRTGQHATHEQVLQELAAKHEIVQLILDYREATKLKSTYVDALPDSVNPVTGRIHTTYNQAVTSTGRLQSQNPNLQNIPIRSDLGKEIRKAFVPRSDEYELLSADYSQIELRVIAALSRERAMIADFEAGHDIHAATAAKVYDVDIDLVTPEMRRNAKMVNFGISYGISAFGLAQRLGISRTEAKQIIDHYFAQYPGIRRYMDETIQFAKKHGYVETIFGRRRYIRDVNSANATVRGGAERNAINAPIQGAAADMIKIAMARIHQEIEKRNLQTRMILQVHDELVFDLYKPEKQEVMALVEDKMKNALTLELPIVIEMGTGRNWLEAH